MNTRPAILGAILLAGSVPAAWAKDPPKSPIDEVIAQAKSAGAADPARAGALLGQAVSLAQKARDLQRESTAADALEELADDLDGRDVPAAADGTRQARPGSRALLAATMKAIDAKRHGAFVSAHALATVLLREAVAHGDGVFVEEAAVALLAYEATPKAGKASAPLARFAEGLRAVGAKDAAKADAMLSQAFEAFAANGWLALALDAATERVAGLLAAKDEARATEAVAKAAALVNADSDFDAVQTWETNGRRRWAGAPPAVLAPFEKAVANRPGGVGAKGGRGGAGGSGSGGNVSDLGRYWPKAGADKPFVTLTRTKDGLVARAAFRKEAAEPLALQQGQRHWDDGGVTVALAGWAVALRIVDFEGLRGQPGERSRPSKARAFYPLAEGETWGVSKNGVVTVTP
jgi:hypothetical protein